MITIARKVNIYHVELINPKWGLTSKGTKVGLPQILQAFLEETFFRFW